MSFKILHFLFTSFTHELERTSGASNEFLLSFKYLKHIRKFKAPVFEGEKKKKTDSYIPNFMMYIHLGNWRSYSWISLGNLPNGVRFCPNPSSSQWVAFIICRFPLFLSLQTVLPDCLIHSHIVWQQVISNVKLQSMSHIP